MRAGSSRPGDGPDGSGGGGSAGGSARETLRDLRAGGVALRGGGHPCGPGGAGGGLPASPEVEARQVGQDPPATPPDENKPLNYYH